MPQPAPVMGGQDGGAMPPGSQSYAGALTVLATLFFIWGFATVINNTLLPHLRSVFQLSYTRTTLIESVWFIAYFVASLPSAWLIKRIGYKSAIITGLLVMAFGALGMVPAARLPSYTVTLISLFVIAGGIALLQVAANPYVTAIGDPRSAPARLNLVQAFNSVGTTLAPLFGGYLILGRTLSGTAQVQTALSPAQRLADARAVQLPYVIVALVLAGIAVLVWRSRLPVLAEATRRGSVAQRQQLSLWQHRNLVLGIPAIFIYLIAEIGVANLFINFVSAPDIGNMSHVTASHYLFLLWGGMMIGRFAGAAVMKTISADRVLAVAAGAAFIVMIAAATLHGPMAMWALILVGLCHSIMFPTIFALGVAGLGPLTEEGSGLLIMAIAGGALVVVQGWIADRFGLQHSFFLTAGCEVFTFYYAMHGCKMAIAK